MNSNPRIMILAGEPSGDKMGAQLAQALIQKDPSVELLGVGGSLMRQNGVQILEDMTRWAVIGLLEVVKHYREFRRVFRELSRTLDEWKPNAVVLIDFPGFNLRFAKRAHRKKVRVIYYVSPQVWAWGKRRLGLMKKIIDRMLVILPFEKDFYERNNMAVDFVGHPLVDEGEKQTSSGMSKELEKFYPRISILPGSRVNEVHRHWDVLLEAARQMRREFPKICFLVPCATDYLYEEIRRSTKGEDFMHLYRGRMRECLLASQFAWVCSGTATLETAYCGVPMIVFYRVSRITAFLIRRLIQVPFVGLVNLVAAQKIVPELLQEDFKSEHLAQMTKDFLSNEKVLNETRQALREVLQKLGEPGASARAAEIILKRVNE
ncbi:MAG: lipid-A-disaccharide synthase [Chlamydiae bacterium]|nr:lipid-A-disaccharide synthase [Chlamydiota bacterium]MBI3266173.1 lipid-A-disaccharide synthase [Chlamydiota bacterium]